MADEIKSGIINGVVYVPAVSAVAGIGDLREALLDVFWGDGYRGKNPAKAAEGLVVVVTDDGSVGGEPFEDFIVSMAEEIARKASS